MNVLQKHVEPIPSPERDERTERPAQGPRHRHALAAILALPLGTLSLAAGAGIGIRHLQKTGFSIETVLGLTLLVVGLVLLAYAATAAWKGLHRWWRLVLVPAAVVVLLTAFSVAVAVMYTVVPPTALGAVTPANQGLDYRDVTFTSTDGVTLSAWLVPSRNGAAVVLEHGAGSTRTATIEHAGVLARHGYGVLMVDARGHGHSGGKGMDLGWYGDRDTTAAVTFLTRQDGVDPTRIGVVGLSMGGEEAIGAAAVDPRISTVVAEGATGRTATDNEDLRPDDYASGLERGMDWVTFTVTDLLTAASPPPSLRTCVTRSGDTTFLLVAAGTVDKEVRAAENMRRAAPARVQVWAVPGSAHTQGLGTAPQEWESRVVGFLDSRLQP